MSEKNKNKIVTILFAIIIILFFFINIIKKDEIISLKEVYKKADKNMYLNKRELKLASNNKEAISK